LRQDKGKGQEIWKGAAMLSGAALFAKIVSAGYRIPFQNIVGDIGFYVYQQIYPFYGLVMMLGMYGFPVVISKYIAEEQAKENETEARLLFTLSFYGLIIFSIALTGILFIGAPFLAKWMGDPFLTDPLRAVSFTFLLLPFLSIGRGFFQGHGLMIPTAVSHVIEQLIRVGGILFLVVLFINSGKGPYGAGVGAAYGSLIGGIGSILVLWIFSNQVKNYRKWRPSFNRSALKGINKSIYMFKQSFYLCLSALVFILFQFIDAFSLIRLLGAYGLEQQAAYVAKGIYDRGQPLLQLGTVLTTTFSLTLVPLLAKAVAKKELTLAHSYHDLALRLTFLIGGAASLGLMVIIEPTNSMLFTNREGSEVLRVMAIAIIGSTLYMTLSAVLQGYGYIHLPAMTIGLGVFTKTGFNLLFVPLLGTIGAALATVCSFAIMVIIQIMMLKKVAGNFSRHYQSYRAIFMALGSMLIVTWGWRTMVETLITEQGRLFDMGLALSTVMVGGFTIFFCLMHFDILDEFEWATIPKLHRLRHSIVKK